MSIKAPEIIRPKNRVVITRILVKNLQYIFRDKHFCTNTPPRTPSSTYTHTITLHKRTHYQHRSIRRRKENQTNVKRLILPQNGTITHEVPPPHISRGRKTRIKFSSSGKRVRNAIFKTRFRHFPRRLRAFNRTKSCHGRTSW